MVHLEELRIIKVQRGFCDHRHKLTVTAELSTHETSFAIQSYYFFYGNSFCYVVSTNSGT